MPRDAENPRAVSHHDVLTLPRDPKPYSFERAHSVEMVHTRRFGIG
jgi:hypothetical protein